MYPERTRFLQRFSRAVEATIAYLDGRNCPQEALFRAFEAGFEPDFGAVVPPGTDYPRPPGRPH